MSISPYAIPGIKVKKRSFTKDDKKAYGTTNISIHRNTHEILKNISNKMLLSQTSVLDIALRHFAISKSLHIRTKQSPKDIQQEKCSEITRLVSNETGISVEEMRATGKPRQVVANAKYEAMVLCMMAGVKVNQIGIYFNRNSSIASIAKAKIRSEIEIYPDLKERLYKCASKLGLKMNLTKCELW